eukprot:SAG31_NODE_727_length_12536_cov_2.306022_10_plen_114_part_00
MVGGAIVQLSPRALAAASLDPTGLRRAARTDDAMRCDRGRSGASATLRLRTAAARFKFAPAGAAGVERVVARKQTDTMGGPECAEASTVSPSHESHPRRRRRRRSRRPRKSEA